MAVVKEESKMKLQIPNVTKTYKHKLYREYYNKIRINNYIMKTK